MVLNYFILNTSGICLIGKVSACCRVRVWATLLYSSDVKWYLLLLCNTHGIDSLIIWITLIRHNSFQNTVKLPIGYRLGVALHKNSKLPWSIFFFVIFLSKFHNYYFLFRPLATSDNIIVATKQVIISNLYKFGSNLGPNRVHSASMSDARHVHKK